LLLSFPETIRTQYGFFEEARHLASGDLLASLALQLFADGLRDDLRAQDFGERFR